MPLLLPKRAKKIKLCGINDSKILDFCLSYHYQPDFLGFVFHPDSKRNISFSLAKNFASLIPPTIKKVAVIVSPSMIEIDRIMANLEPDLLQIHGEVSLEFISQIKSRYPIPIIKAVTITNVIPEMLSAYQNSVDFILFDQADFGGTGKKFDWEIIANQSFKFPWFLSGGINISNLPLALTKAEYIDLSSGIESEKGIKDQKKIAGILDFMAIHGC